MSAHASVHKQTQLKGAAGEQEEVPHSSMAAYLLMSEKKSKELPGTGKGSEVWAALSYTLNTPSCISKSKGATGWGSHSKGSPLIWEGAAASCMPGCCSAGETLAANNHLSLHAAPSSCLEPPCSHHRKMAIGDCHAAITGELQGIGSAGG